MAESVNWSQLDSFHSFKNVAYPIILSIHSKYGVVSKVRRRPGVQDQSGMRGARGHSRNGNCRGMPGIHRFRVRFHNNNPEKQKMQPATYKTAEKPVSPTGRVAQISMGVVMGPGPGARRTDARKSNACEDFLMHNELSPRAPKTCLENIPS